VSFYFFLQRTLKEQRIKDKNTNEMKTIKLRKQNKKKHFLAKEKYRWYYFFSHFHFPKFLFKE